MSDKEVMKQGDRYEEEDVEVMDGEEKKGFSPPPKKLLILGGGIFAVLLIIVIAMTFIGGKDKEPAPEVDTPIVDDGGGFNIIEEEPYAYTQDEIEALRRAGYTGHEIDDAEANQLSVMHLLTEARTKQEEYLREVYAELRTEAYSEGSASYRTLLEDTWLAGEEKVVYATDTFIYNTETLKENVDYIKLPPRGGQLFVKITTPDGLVLFYNVHPSRYQQLRDEGNMIITYDQITYGDELFYTNIKEVNP